MNDDIDSTVSSKFDTKDLNQAAFIFCQPGARLVRLVPNQEKGLVVRFQFELPMPEQDLAALILRYANGETLVDPLDYCVKQSSLRDLLHNCRQEYRNKV